jgi:CHC2 zinc finger
MGKHYTSGRIGTQTMKVSDFWGMTVTNQFDWNAIKDRVNAAKIATNLMGPAPGRRGERGRRLWWRCPFHNDKNPSLGIEPGKPWWRCFGCGEHGDAANLVMRINKVAFPEAVRMIAELAGTETASGGSSRPRPPARPRSPPPASQRVRLACPWPMHWPS